MNRTRSHRDWTLLAASAATLALLAVGATGSRVGARTHAHSTVGQASTSPLPLGEGQGEGRTVGQASSGTRREGQASSGTRRVAALPKLIDLSTPTMPEARGQIMLCQALGPAAPWPVCGVDCASGNCCQGWESMRMIMWQQYAQGEYVGQARTPHVAEYRLRVGDDIDLVYRLTREETAKPKIGRASCRERV